MSQDRDYGENPWRDEDILRELYHEQGMTQAEIAEELGCGEGTVNRYIHNFNLEVNNIGSTNEKIRDVDLWDLYWEQEMNQSEIAEYCDCSVGLVSEEMKRRDIPVRGGYDGSPTCYTGRQSGYERFYCRDCGEMRKFLHHRLLALVKYDLDELKGKDVHHINGVQWDNRIENIELMTTEEHARYHYNPNQMTDTAGVAE